MTARRDWLDDAACTTVGDDPFYPPNGEHPTAALTICATCPVTTECLEDAIRTGDLDYGIRAGMTPLQRRRYAAKKSGQPVTGSTVRTGRVVGECYTCNQPTPTSRHVYCPPCGQERRRRLQASYDAGRKK